MPWSSIFLRGMRSTLLVIKQIPTKQNAILIEKKALAVLGDTVCGIGVVQDDLRQNIIRLAADTPIQIVLDLTRYNPSS